MSLWKRWRRLPPIERRLVVRALVLLWSVRIVLWALPFKTWRRAFKDLWQPAPAAPATSSGTGPATPDRIAQAVRRASRAVPSTSCLVQAVAVQKLLRRHGHDGELHIGVAKDERGDVEAHAWVVHEGRVLLGWVPEISNYVPLPPPDAGSR